MSNCKNQTKSFQEDLKLINQSCQNNSLDSKVLKNQRLPFLATSAVSKAVLIALLNSRQKSYRGTANKRYHASYLPVSEQKVLLMGKYFLIPTALFCQVMILSVPPLIQPLQTEADAGQDSWLSSSLSPFYYVLTDATPFWSSIQLIILHFKSLPAFLTVVLSLES